MQIKELSGKEEILRSFAVMSQIYEDISLESYVEDILNMMQRGYRMAAVFEGQDMETKCIGAIGIRIARRLQYGKVLEIEDFMICRQKRGIGVGKMLIRWAEWQAANFDCTKILATLDTKRIESHKILSREHFLMEGFKFCK